MSKWSTAKAKQVLKALKSIGWKVKRQTGSHKILEKSGKSPFLRGMRRGFKPPLNLNDRLAIGYPILIRHRQLSFQNPCSIGTLAVWV